MKHFPKKLKKLEIDHVLPKLRFLTKNLTYLYINICQTLEFSEYLQVLVLRGSRAWTELLYACDDVSDNLKIIRCSPKIRFVNEPRGCIKSNCFI